MIEFNLNLIELVVFGVTCCIVGVILFIIGLLITSYYVDYKDGTIRTGYSPASLRFLSKDDNKSA